MSLRIPRPAGMLLFSLCLASVVVLGAQSPGLYLIDAHSQIDETVDLDGVIPMLDRAGIRQVILTTVGNRRQPELLQFARRHPDRILPAVRLRTREYLDNDPSFEAAFERQVGAGNYGAISEVLMYHAKKERGATEGRAPEVIVYPTDQRVQVVLRSAIAHGWPLVVHIEFASKTIDNRVRFMSELEAMLDAHPEHPFTMAHMGQLGANEVRRLIAAHANIYFQTSHADPVERQSRQEPWINMFRGNSFAPERRDLLVRYPDRFIVAFDNVFPEHWSETYVQDGRLWLKALAELPPVAAAAIAHGNAERLWKFPAR